MNGSLAQIIAGATAGITTSLVVCPLDVVKIRIQGQLPQPVTTAGLPDWRSMGMARSLRYILATEGLRGWYRGLGTTMVTYIPAMSVYFPTYTFAKSAWSSTLQENNVLRDVSVNHPVVHMMAAISAGGLTNVVTQPLWMVRTRQMSSSTPNHRSTVEVLSRVIQREGFLALFKGLGPSMLGIFHVIIQFPLYERIKLTFKSHPEDPNTPGQIFLASTASKICASTATYPHEVIRTRLQLQRGNGGRYRGVWQTIRTIWVEEGCRGFYGGLQINIMRVVPAGAITFVTYEMIVQSFQH